MAPSPRSAALLATLAVVLAGAGYTWWPKSDGAPGVKTAPRGAAAKAAASAPPATAPDVHLEALDETRPMPSATERNLFRFTPKVAPARVLPPPREVIAPSGPPPPPPVPPIGLKFIGLLEAAGATRIAILSDGIGAPIYGKEGESVLGRYRILRIGSESIEMDYLDGQGRQTIRLSGS